MFTWFTAQAALGFLRRAWPYLLGAILVVSIYAWDRHRMHAEYARGFTDGSAKVQAQFDAFKDKQEKIVTNLALLWAKAIQNVEVRYVTVEKTRVIRFAAARTAIGKIRDATDQVAVPVSADAAGVLRDIHAGANAAATDSAAVEGDHRPAAAVPAAAGSETTLTDWLKFAADAGEAYRAAEDKRQACVSAYDQVRAAQEGLK